MTLTPEQLSAREGKLTASRVSVLMRGDDEAVYDLWRELIGDPSYEPPDLSGVWPVQLGTVTETLNLNWYERKTGRAVTMRGDVIVSGERDWAAATLDGMDAQHPDGPAVIECKHVGGFETLETIVARYMPQIHWQMYVTGAEIAVLSIIEGARAPVVEEVRLHSDYVSELLQRADDFWRYVTSLTPPVMPPPVKPPRPAAAREVDMSTSNEWGSFAPDWIEHRDAAKAFRDAEKKLKALVPDDAARAYGHGIEVKKTRNGALRIGELKDG